MDHFMIVELHHGETARYYFKSGGHGITELRCNFGKYTIWSDASFRMAILDSNTLQVKHIQKSTEYKYSA